MRLPQIAWTRSLLVLGVFIIILMPIPERNALQKNMEGKHACACTLDCMDGRVQDVVKEGTKREFGADIVDVITQAGMVKVLAENKNKALIDNFKYELEISVRNHGAKGVTIAAHEDCAGNRVSKEQQIRELREAKKIIESWNLGIMVVMLWVEKPFKEVKVIE